MSWLQLRLDCDKAYGRGARGCAAGPRRPVGHPGRPRRRAAAGARRRARRRCGRLFASPDCSPPITTCSRCCRAWRDRAGARPGAGGDPRRQGLGARVDAALPAHALRRAPVDLSQLEVDPPDPDASTCSSIPASPSARAPIQPRRCASAALDSLPCAGLRVVDFGCGSGILGVAALKLGAARLLASTTIPRP
jgi:hypothetical protein